MTYFWFYLIVCIATYLGYWYGHSKGYNKGYEKGYITGDVEGIVRLGKAVVERGIRKEGEK